MTIDRFGYGPVLPETDDAVETVHRVNLADVVAEGDDPAYRNSKFSEDFSDDENLRGAVRDKLHKILTGEDD